MTSPSKFIKNGSFEVGSVGWDAIFATAHLVRATCSHCDDAVSLMVFAKDIINLKKGDPIYDKANFKRWIHNIKIWLDTSTEQGIDFAEREIADFDEIIAKIESKALDHKIFAEPSEVGGFEQIVSVEHPKRERKIDHESIIRVLDWDA